MSLGFEVNVTFAVVMALLDTVVMSKCARNLGSQLVMKQIDKAADVVPYVSQVKANLATVAWIKHVLEVQ